ncbi:SET domain-containing protein-lysine N-methyltransferase [Comamonas sp. JUb58]|uniref:SET domain-containing protein n=1 Tax=Comamonas sp. JUb58 TaxID=2485114 RepID=UPI00105C0713|nr:SET domain-containing protein-lysine N-methyltransferase [Comamonas sp. JUb58]TDS82460.1 hypothetical protein EDF71_10795 [Comamonas sp. JUb58]
MPNHVPHFSTGRRIQVRRSGVHGRGVFALQDIAEGEVIVEYAGKVISYEESQRRHPHDPDHPNHTFFFQIDGDRVIDGGDGGNSARWINHSCDPNCFAEEVDDRIFISALRNISAGEELGYDYGLIIEERYTAKLKADYACHCGAAECRGTMLAPKRGWKPKVPASDLPEPVLPKKRKAKAAAADGAKPAKPAKAEKNKAKAADKALGKEKAKDKKKSDKKAKADKKTKGQKAAKADKANA